MFRAHHLHDDRLFDCYLAERGGERIDPPAAEHLADCPECAARFAEFAGCMDTLREEGDAEADAIFTPDRLRAQQQQIARRIEHIGRHARVISFPGQFSHGRIAGGTTRTATRWAAAAAAAGLFIGLALGASFEWGARARGRVTSTASAQASARPARMAPAITRSPAATSDDAFLLDLEVALERPRTRELVAYDAFTPHVREISQR